MKVLDYFHKPVWPGSCFASYDIEEENGKQSIELSNPHMKIFSFFSFVATSSVFLYPSGSLGSPENLEIMPYLVKWSELDHDHYCLALLFTYRDFADGALGLAWVAEPDLDTPGGICSKRVLLEDENKAFNFNTAVASFKNYGMKVPRKASVITVTHEFGHSFGSEVRLTELFSSLCAITNGGRRLGQVKLPVSLVPVLLVILRENKIDIICNH